MSAISKHEHEEFLRVLANIKDERTRYFFMMLGDAIGEGEAAAPTAPAEQDNIVAARIGELRRRINE